ncbi:MAG: InlB B-repeat-containing protein [Nitrososphaerota archaeon]|jgi:uncharacterized repeat protein (TIGR02543 family)|nr:InlB B-repeat-containing protein [Nitrososphaerota archaeon]
MINIIVKKRTMSLFLCMLLGLTLIWSTIPDTTITSAQVSNNKMIALTFDDGPSTETDRLLNILNANNAKATFFVLGSKISQYPSVIAKASTQGCDIFGHSWNHNDLTTLTPTELTQDLKNTNNAIFNATGIHPNMFRPPYLAYNDDVINAAKDMGLAIILCAIDSADWETLNATAIYNQIMNEAWDGAIILCHDIYAPTVDALAQAIPDLIADGYDLVTVSELLGKTNPGQLYSNSIGDWKGHTYTIMANDSLWDIAEKFSKTTNTRDIQTMMNDIITLNKIKDANDIPDGLILRIPCTDAGSLYHQWDDDDGVYTNPTCTTNGYWTYTCLKCTLHHIEKDNGPLAGHTEHTETVAATNTKDGYIKVTCTICSKELNYTVLEATGYPVTYDATGGTDSPIGGQYKQGVIVPVSSVVPTKTGYVFAGWLYNGVVYFGGSSFVMPNASVTLVAQWTVNSTFVVLYDVAGGSGGPVNGTQYVAGANVTVLGVVPVRAGYVFAGWLYSGVVYSGGDLFVMPSAGVTLVAQWVSNPTFVVLYDVAGGSDGPDTGLYEPGVSVVVLGVVPVRAGYVFAGWLYSGIVYFGGLSFVMPSAGVTLVAQWTAEQLPTYVFYDVAGGSDGPDNDTPYAAGDSIVVSGVVPVRAGYVFAGWLYNGLVYSGGGSFVMPTDGVTLVAQWVSNPMFVVLYDVAGGSAGPATGFHVAGVSVVVSGVVPVRAGYVFAGWLYSGVVYSGSQMFVMPSAGVTLVAQWTANPTFVVFYDVAGGSSGPDIDLHESGVSVVVSGVVPVREGYAFAGWRYDGVIYFGGDSFVMPVNNVKITAQWIDSALAPYTVIYNANGGVNAPTDPRSPYVSGITVTVLGQGSMTRSGYTFSGWAVNSTSSRICVEGEAFIITGNTILYAIWTETPASGGNSGGSGSGSGTTSSQSNSAPSLTPAPSSIPSSTLTPTSSGSSNDDEESFWSFWRIVLVMCIVLGVSAVLAVVGVTDGLLPKKRGFVA